MGTTDHAAFIVAAYAVAGAVVGGLIAWITLDYRAQLRTLADLEKLGFVRRSARAEPAVPAVQRPKEKA